MLIKYYKLEGGGLMRYRNTGRELYLERLTKAGRWVEDSPALAGYIYMGEPGADKVSAAEAHRIARTIAGDDVEI
jgi:hypothetical protein